MEIEKDIKSENGMTTILPKFSQSEISNENTSSFGIENFDFFDSDSSVISEFMSLSLNSKIEKFKSNSSYRKLKDKNSSNTFLHYICMNDENYLMMDLIKPTIKEMDSQNNIGQTPLHISLINKNKKISTYLIENGANVNISDNNLNTSLHLAVKIGDVDIVQLLIQYKANPFLLNKNNETVLDIAIKLNYKECINVLKEISLMNEANYKYNKNDNLNNKISNIKYKNINNNNTINGNIYIKTYGNSLFFDNNKNNIQNIQTFNKKINYIKKNNDNTIIPKNDFNLKHFDSKSNNKTEIRKNFFLSNTKVKSIHRTNSTSLIDVSCNNKTYQDKIYMKKIVPRSQSGTRNKIQTIANEKTEVKESLNNNIFNNNKNLITNSNNDLYVPPHQNNIPRKTDFPIQNEKFLELDNDNESEEEEESIIRENQEGIKPKTISSLKNIKTLKINPLTETNNKINPYTQIDSYVSAIHKSDQGIAESDGYIKEDGLLIIEPSIDISKIDDTITETQNETKYKNESFKEENNKKEKQLIKDDLYTFLKNIQMEQYNDLLVNEGFDDINLILSQMKTGLPINDDILREIGIEKPGDRAKILVRIQEVSHMFEFKIPFEAIYYKNKKPFKLLKYDFHVKAVQNWLKKLQLQNYLENFYNNGYYSPELIFIQKASKFPINDTILERDLKISNPHDRKLIMNSISSNSKNYVSELQKNTLNKKSNKKNEGKNKEKEEIKCFIF